MPETLTTRFGPLLDSTGVTFRLWAPAADAVTLVTAPGTPEEALRPMTGEAGWWSCRVEGAGAGTRYQFRVGDLRVPDPASRFQPDDVHAASEVVDLAAYRWRHDDWRGRPWAETVLYELHPGTFSPEGTYAGIRQKLDHLVDLGVTAIELMPLADFPGSRNWGYDGVLMFAPDSAYGRPEDLMELIDEAHGRGLMVFLDVVYNHFGPDGNYLHAYAPGFFDPEVHTPWGAAIDYTRPEVRRFVVENALFWLDTYRFDGLRLDAVHAIDDPSRPHVLEELAGHVRALLGPERHVHLVLENDANEAHHLDRSRSGAVVRYDAQWNDDYHHVGQHLLTGEVEGYYADYTTDPVGQLARALVSGFVQQGEPSAYRGGELRGEPSGHLPPSAFVNFLQNHDQIGNRAFGDRLTTLAPERARAAMTTVLLMAPQPPLLFMGEEWASTRPFLYFTDFHDELADAVREGRRREFRRFAAFADPAARARIPDPNAASTFEASRLDWEALADPLHASWLARTRELLARRREVTVPLLGRIEGAEAERLGERGLVVTWHTAGGPALVLVANLGDDPLEASLPRGRLVASSTPVVAAPLPGWTAAWWELAGSRA
ncbi:MAG: malto-oligosyltrehalose trehalohydrolase [Pseudomonadota bacterium]